MNEAVEAGEVGTVGSTETGSEENTPGVVTGIPTDYRPNSEDSVSQEGAKESVQPKEGEVSPETTPSLQEGQWLLKDGVLGSGDRPPHLLEKYGYNQENQAKAYPDAEKKLGELNQRLGAFTGAPDKYDFSSIEDDKFAFDQKDKTFNSFVTECQNANVSQDFALKVAGLAKDMLHEPEVNALEEAKNYGPSFEADKKNIVRWVNNNVGETDGMELLNSVNSAAGMRALNALMNANGVTIPTGGAVPAIPKETLKDVQQDLAANLYEGDNLAKNPEKLKEYVEKFKKVSR
jgi:hypothetical protein